MTNYSRVADVFAHAVTYIVAIAVAAQVISAFYTLPGLVPITTNLVVICALAMMFHRRSNRLCVRCMTEVPADAPARAQRRKRVLWLTHFLATRTGVAVVLVLVLAGPLLLAAVRTSETENLCRTMAGLTTFILIYAQSLHHRLRPWCPYCRDWDDDGDPEPSPDPTTFGTKTAH